MKDPHEVVSDMGEYKVVYGLNVAKAFPKTCAAMDKVAKAGARDDEDKREGQDDYTVSLDKLFDAFDTFIREKSKGKHSAGYESNYDLKKPCDLTIYLIWQIRHMWTHFGGVINEKCKNDYGRIISKAAGFNTFPVVDLPKEIDVGYEIIINFEEYRIINECVMNYIKDRVSKEDFIIISKRSSITNLMTSRCLIYIDYEFGRVEIDLLDLYEKGCEINPDTKEVIFPGSATYDFEEEKIILGNGNHLPAKLIRFQNIPPMPIKFYAKGKRLILEYVSKKRKVQLIVQFNEREECLEARLIDNKYKPSVKWELKMSKERLIAIGKSFEKKFSKKKKFTSQTEYYQFNEELINAMGVSGPPPEALDGQFDMEPFLNALVDKKLVEKKRMQDTLNDKYPIGIIKKFWGTYIVIPMDNQWMFYMNLRVWMKLYMKSPIYQGINEFMEYIEEEGLFDHYGDLSPEVIRNAKVFLFSHIRRIEIIKEESKDNVI